MDSEIDFKKLTDAMVEVFTLYQSAITQHGVKDIASELKKAKATIYAEMSLENLHIYLETIENYSDLAGKPSYLPKLGLVDVMIGMERTGNVSPLVAMAAYFNHACFPLPRSKNLLTPSAAARAMAKITQVASQECTESFNAVIGFLAGDGVVDKREAEKVSKECLEAINALAELKAIADAIKG